MLKNILIVVLSIYGVVAQAQQDWSFASSHRSQQLCGKQIAQKVVTDMRFTDLNNLVLYTDDGVMVSGMNTLGAYYLKSQDKNGFDYQISFYVDMVQTGEATVCSIGKDYPFSIVRIDNNEKVFDLQCAAQGKAFNCQ